MPVPSEPDPILDQLLASLDHSTRMLLLNYITHPHLRKILVQRLADLVRDFGPLSPLPPFSARCHSTCIVGNVFVVVCWQCSSESDADEEEEITQPVVQP